MSRFLVMAVALSACLEARGELGHDDAGAGGGTGEAPMAATKLV